MADTLILKPIEELGFSSRLSGVLKAADIHYIGELLSKSRADILKIPNIGLHALLEIESALEANRWTFGMNIPRDPISDGPNPEHVEALRAFMRLDPDKHGPNEVLGTSGRSPKT